MINLILIILLIPSIYFSVRFFLISKNIKEVTNNLIEIDKDLECNRKLKLLNPDKNFEKLLIEINKNLELSQFEKIKYVNRESEIRKEIENISHDLRTPLTSIRGYLELIKDKTITENEKREYISIIEKRAKGLQNLIQIFYDLSRLENKEYSINLEPIDINKELREQLLIFYNDFEKANIDVEIKLDNNPIYSNLDKNAIERVFVNLIQNAIKYSKSSFKVNLEKIEEVVIITFSNDIHDLDKYEEKYLFNRFYMKDDSRSNKSSGLGLTVSKLLVESMGGNIKVEIKEEWIVFELRFLII
ncbi:sensor histidine kinase [Paraclostridium bifermentans]|uniref:sensor histidine kinase n=1 Tax=Paraclostridium bifermentans TaxID=1490 RepID=UPI00359C62ED